jgi:membrane-bound serine protease (ClpP class)
METMGLVLLGAAVVLFVVEVFAPTGGLVGLLGIAALVAAGITLDVPWPVIAVVVVAIAAFGLLFGRKVWSAQKQERVMTGWEELVGDVGVVRQALAPAGEVFIQGALWRAQVEEGAEPVEAGQRVRVREVEGLTLVVEPAPEAREDLS